MAPSFRWADLRHAVLAFYKRPGGIVYYVAFTEIASEVMTTRASLFRWTCFGAAVAAAALLFMPAVRYTIIMFRNPAEDLSHGWLVPLVSVYAIWRCRADLRSAARNPDARGLAAVLACLALFWLGTRGGQQPRLTQVAMAGTIVALPFAFWGIGVVRHLWFPAAYLLFIVPMSFLDAFTLHLRQLTAGLASGLLNGMGVEVEKVGTALAAGGATGFQLNVADPCSGIRSIFALAALTAAYAYFTQKTAWSRWVLFACAVPLAFLGNLARIMSIALVAHWLGQEKALGFYHDYSGYVVFGVAVLLMVQIGLWLEHFGPARATEPATIFPPPDQRPPAKYAWLVCIAVPALIIACWLVMP